MKKFRFKLETVLRLKRRIEEERQNQYGVAKRLRVEAERQVERRRQQIEILLVSYQQSMVQQFDLIDLNNYHNYLIWLDKMLELDITQLHAARQKEIAALNELIEASKERKMVDKLKDKAYEQYRIDEAQEETKFLDELGTGRFTRQSRES